MAMTTEEMEKKINDLTAANFVLAQYLQAVISAIPKANRNGIQTCMNAVRWTGPGNAALLQQQLGSVAR